MRATPLTVGTKSCSNHLLVHRLEVRVAAPALEVINYTVDLDEVACGVSLACQDLAFSCSLLMNVLAPRPILVGYSAYSKKR